MNKDIIKTMKSLIISNQKLLEANQAYIETLAKQNGEDMEKYEKTRKRIKALRRELQQFLTAQ